MNQTQFLSEEIKLSSLKKFIFHFLLALMLAISLTFSQASFAEPDGEEEIELEDNKIYTIEQLRDAILKFESYKSGREFHETYTGHSEDIEHVAFGKGNKTGDIFVVIKKKGQEKSDVFHLKHNSAGTFSSESYSAPVDVQKQLHEAHEKYKKDRFPSNEKALENAKYIDKKGQDWVDKVEGKQKEKKQKEKKQKEKKQKEEKRERQKKERQEQAKQRQEQFRQQEQRRVNRVDRLGTRQQKTIKPSTIKPKTQQKTKVITKTKPDIVLSKKDAKKTRDKWYNPQTWFADDSKTEESH